MARILGAVLAGGKSRRFGSDKAAADYAGRPLIAHAIAALAPFVETVVVCGRDAPGLASLADRPRADLGPLGGINAALHHAAADGFDGVLTTGCDMPDYPAELAAALIGSGAAVLDGQPLAGWWPAALAAALDEWLATPDRLAVRAWFDTLDGRIIRLPELRLPNVNTREDLAALERRG